MLLIHLISVFGKPVGGFGDFLLGHVIPVCILGHRLIDDTSDVVAFSIRVDDSAIRSKRGGACFGFRDEELLFVGRLVYKGDKGDFRIADGVCLSIVLLMPVSPPFHIPQGG